MQSVLSSAAASTEDTAPTTATAEDVSAGTAGSAAAASAGANAGAVLLDEALSVSEAVSSGELELERHRHALHDIDLNHQIATLTAQLSQAQHQNESLRYVCCAVLCCAVLCCVSYMLHRCMI